MSGEKQFDATEHRIQKAREDEGQVATSQDLMRSAVCLVVFEAGRAIFERYHRFAEQYFQEFIGQIALLREGAGFNVNNVFVWLLAAVGLSIVLSSTAVVVFILTSWVQTRGPIFKKHPVEFKIDKLDPTKFFQNVFSAKTAVDFIGNLVKATVITVIFGFSVVHVLREAPLATAGGIESIGRIIGIELLSAVRSTLVVLLFLAAFDFWVQTRLTLRSLRMSFQEVKEEQKEMMGNAEMKQHLRQMGHELLDGDGGKAPDPLQGSNALVVNPTHLAVGLRYVQGEKRLPQIRVKASDARAMALIEIARDQNVPVIRHIWLARTLYELEEGAPIPREAFRAVAAVYRMLFKLDEAFRKTRAAGTAEFAADAAAMESLAATATGEPAREASVPPRVGDLPALADATLAGPDP